MFPRLKTWILLAIVITGLSGLVYLAVQQDLRLSANDPQIQIAQDISQSLLNGKKIEEVIPRGEVDLSKSLASFVIIFNKDRQPLTSSVVSEGRIPTPPIGVFDWVDQHEEDRLTWQTKTGERIATIILPINGSNPGYVLVGRSLREVEKRENQLEYQIGLVWICLLITTFIIHFLLTAKKK